LKYFCAKQLPQLWLIEVANDFAPAIVHGNKRRPCDEPFIRNRCEIKIDEARNAYTTKIIGETLKHILNRGFAVLRCRIKGRLGASPIEYPVLFPDFARIC
jgi:hypothetical protein